jgi:hypothetical protein
MKTGAAASIVNLRREGGMQGARFVRAEVVVDSQVKRSGWTVVQSSL